VNKYWTCDYDEPKWFDNQTNLSIINTSEPILHSVRWTDYYQLNDYTFEWNASGANCDQWTNASAGSLSGTEDWSNITQTIPISCEGKNVYWRVYGNDSFNQNNLTNSFFYPVQNLSPTMNEKFINESGTLFIDITVCLNLSNVNDTGVGQSNGSVFNETMLDNDASIPCDGIANDGWYGVNVEVGDTEGTFCYNDTYANDTLNNIEINATDLCLTIQVEQAPKWYDNSTNITTVNPADAVSHNVNWTEPNSQELGVSILEINATGANCNTEANLTTIDLTSSSAWANHTWTVTEQCENEVIGWKQYGNDTNNNMNYTVVFQYDVQGKSPRWRFNQTNVSSPSPNEAVLHSINWTDAGSNLGQCTFEWNGTGSWENTTETVSGQSDWCNATKTIPDDREGQAIGWKQYGNDSKTNMNDTDIFVYSIPSANPVIADSQHIMNQSVVGSNEAVGFGIYVTDNSGNSNVTITIEGAN
jgi:hypothetical protein